MLDQFLGDIPTPVKFILAFAIVIALVFIVIWLMRKLSGQRLAPAASGGRSRQPRLGVLDVLMIDSGRRLVILRRDNVEHLVMIGGPNDLVIESGILRGPPGMATQRDPALGAPIEPPARATPPQPIPATQTRASPPDRPAGGPIPSELQRAPQLRMPESPTGREPSGGREPTPARQTAPAAQAMQRSALQRPGGAARPVPPETPPPAPKPARDRQEPRGIELTAEDLEADFVKGEDREAAEPRASDARREQAKAPTVPGPAAPRAASATAGQPIIAGPALRQSELADRLSAALQRPVTPVERGPQANAPETAAPEIDGPQTSRPETSRSRTAAPEFGAPDVVTHASDDLPRKLPTMSDDAPGAAGAAPEVKPDRRAAADADEAGDDPLASLEAEMANLLGRDVGRSNS